MDLYTQLRTEVKTLSAMAVVNELKKLKPEVLRNKKELMRTLQVCYPNVNHESVMRMAREYENKSTKEQDRIANGCTWMRIPGVNC